MTTHGVISVFDNSGFAVAHRSVRSGNPSADGNEILRFLKEPGNIERLTEGLQHVDYLTEEGCEEFEPMDISSSDNSVLPSLSHNTGANILEMVAQATAEKRVPICPSASLSFAIHDWCHWFYMVDLDSETFQVFGNINGNRVYRSCHRSFVPAMIKVFPFSQLPATGEEFICALKEGVEERDRSYPAKSRISDLNRLELGMILSDQLAEAISD
jgi:hypothetical protein